MRIATKYFFFSLLLSLFLMSASVSAQKDTFVGSSSSINFPDVEGWQTGDTTRYPTAELGYSIGYKSDAGEVVTIYVYNGGKKKIADGIDDKVVKNEIKQAGSDIEALGEAGHYSNVKKIKDETVTLGGTSGKTKTLFSLYTFKIRGRDVESEIYLFGYQNNFIKIRATRPKSADGKASEDFTNLLSELDKLFSK